jgi:hypothetical protein
MNDVEIGSVWFVWGQHQRVAAERNNLETGMREVRLVPMGTKQKTPWVEDHRVRKHGILSPAYNEGAPA